MWSLAVFADTPSTADYATAVARPKSEDLVSIRPSPALAGAFTGQAELGYGGGVVLQRPVRRGS